ncbi:MAG: alpha/beta hydrolase [Flavobacterium lindanitolerans]|uniref:alpha/beta fold hydrolase n=1 Tax=Flavobacterium lindanitolerans TaxID=428988 RepID=UPI001A60E3DD|nr:alpha/beta hydrolase [Flavobacterium lindanitolerans]MBL7867220.1 alpha/beta hydrolase [Flavobacterium lindanitolerans]
MKKMLKLTGYTLGTLLILIVILFAAFYQRDKTVEELKPLYTNHFSAFMPIMGMQVHYRDEGNKGDSTPLLLIHGMSSSLNTFDSVALILKKQRRVISIDMPAFGLTGPNPENKYSFAYYSLFLDSFLNRLQIPVCDIAGNSLGGGIAWQFTVTHPESVRKLILINASGYPVKNAKGSLGFKIASTPVINNLMLYITPKALVRKSLEGIYYNKNIVTPAQVSRFQDMAISQGNRSAFLSIIKNGFEQEPDKINSINKPTLIIWGAKDGLIPVENAYLFNKNIKGSKLVVLKNIGHVPMEEAPRETAELIAGF